MHIFIYIYISYVRLYAYVLLLNGWTDFDKIFCAWLRCFENGLDSQFDPIENVLLINLFIYDLWYFDGLGSQLDPVDGAGIAF